MASAERFLVSLFIIQVLVILTASARDLRLVTVATRENDGYKRFLRSAQNAGLEVTALGMGQEWQGGAKHLIEKLGSSCSALRAASF